MYKCNHADIKCQPTQKCIYDQKLAVAIVYSYSLNKYTDIFYTCVSLVARRPTMRELEKYVIQQTVEGAGVVIHWERLGLELGESQNVLDVIKRDLRDVSSCCKEVLSQWLSKSPAATWNDLIKAFDNLNLPVASSELKWSLMKSKYSVYV